MREPETLDEALANVVTLAVEGFTDWASLGHITAHYSDDLVLLSYTREAMYAGEWNLYEQVCRGLVLSYSDDRVVARPFDKFFNWGEGGRQTDAPIEYVQEKMDGSLIIASWWNGEYLVHTRGSLSSEQARWAKGRIDGVHADGLRDVPARWTLLLEAVYPQNRIVVDYGGREGLYLLAMRDRVTGDYAPWDFVRTVADMCGFAQPRVYERLTTTADILAALDGMSHNEEGFVAVFTDGSRFKFKSAAYLALHRALAGLSYKTAVEALRDGRIEEMRQAIPEELRAEWDGWVADIQQTVTLTRLTVKMKMTAAPSGDRKTFAQWVNTNPEKWLRSLLFAEHDGHDITPIIYDFILRGKVQSA